MSWWTKSPEERAHWVLDPLAGVGPLRFGMAPEQVQVALNQAVPAVSQGLQGDEYWQPYSEVGVTAIYRPGRGLVAVAVGELDGPLIRLRDIELIGRIPSEVDADIRGLARWEGAAVRVNWSGDPEVAAWGLSMGARQEWGLSAKGYFERRDTMVTTCRRTGRRAQARTPHRAQDRRISDRSGAEGSRCPAALDPPMPW